MKKGYIGKHRRKVGLNDAPRDKFGKKIFHGVFTGGIGFNAEEPNDDIEEFTPTQFHSSTDKPAQHITYKMEDFMDDQDYDEQGKSMLKLAPQEPYKGLVHMPPNFNQIQVQMLKKFKIEPEDLINYESEILSHNIQPTNRLLDAESVTEWIEEKQDEIVLNPIPKIYDFDSSLLKLPTIKGNIVGQEPTIDEDEFNFNALFHKEGELVSAKESFGRNFQRTVVPWEPDKRLFARYQINMNGCKHRHYIDIKDI